MAKKVQKNKRTQYCTIRLKLMERGWTLRRWAIHNQVQVGTVYNAVAGHRNGIKALQIRSKLDDFLKYERTH